MCANEDDYSAPLYTDWKKDECNQDSSELVIILGIQSAIVNDCSIHSIAINNEENRTLAIEIAVPIGIFFLILIVSIFAFYFYRKKKLSLEKKEKVQVPQIMELPQKILDIHFSIISNRCNFLFFIFLEFLNL